MADYAGEVLVESSVREAVHYNEAWWLPQNSWYYPALEPTSKTFFLVITTLLLNEWIDVILKGRGIGHTGLSDILPIISHHSLSPGIPLIQVHWICK